MEKVVALAGNPNVGKSTVFNALTGLKQHTGNWPGKTVECAKGNVEDKGNKFQLVDLPGSYSLLAHSEEEEIARDFICFEKPDAVIVVCDGTTLERNMNLVLQIMETTKNVILCVNLLDEAKRKNIEINLNKLSDILKIPVIGTAARSGKGLEKIFPSLYELFSNKKDDIYIVRYPEELEREISILQEDLEKFLPDTLNARWATVRVLEDDKSFFESLSKHENIDLSANKNLDEKIKASRLRLQDKTYNLEKIKDSIVEAFVNNAEEICKDTVIYKNKNYNQRDRKLDKLFTSKTTGFLIMFLLLLGVFWITIAGANVPSDLINKLLFSWEDNILAFLKNIGLPKSIYGPLVFGVYRVVAWVISVMLPPMAIFFPLFTLLEDFGYLPRVAFNLDKYFQKCNACGKQALTMCMGFGCNAAGVTGCKIIDSPRERLIAILTNNFVPCNGRFPTIIATITMFLVMGFGGGFLSSLFSAFILALVIILGVFITILASKILSETLLKGIPSSFTLELPPYRVPQVGTVIVRSIFDRTIFVLGRAVVVAAPAGIIIWILANINFGDMSILNHLVNFLEPLARLMGLDGVILTAFLLGSPANEIVVPIIIMTYLSKGSLLEIDDINVMRNLLVNNGWTIITAINVILFSLMHWPCGTTLLTIHKETGSIKWTVISFLLPTVFGIVSCICFTSLAKLFLAIF
ncbi:ferrous iron transport protein B [Peptoniphilus lacrimalis]|uniref:Ferrous iron transport protein B n=1 Tax=Peptoniphilus lacrimalis TaxID=33031 RepID=A0A379C5V8_9FIRM|nr:ferrous iron transport protein B [Peptoniphilus lacrimalis]MDK8282644.1 ferrous iron transport protein B [Peptoniphilus lacrimalis]SUB57614.1 Ferrous iron transport protein B [Peptoniphilus lacrimalis]